MANFIRIYCLSLLLGISAQAQRGDRDGHVMEDKIPAEQIPPAPVLPVDEAMKTFEVQEGFVLEPVAAEPQVFNPITMVFDGDGRMWVCEMTTFMNDVDGVDEEAAEGNIAVLEDSSGDGQVDKRTVFLDDIILPRTVALVKGGILYADNTQLFFAEVLEGLKLGAHEVVDPVYAKGGTIEHKPNTMFYALDNWYYNAKSKVRYKALALDAAIPDGVEEIYRNQYFKMVKGPSEFRGQWGLSMDDYGRLFHNGNSQPASGEYLRPNSLNTSKAESANIGDSRIYPIRMNPGINRGYMDGMLTEEGKLARFTAASGNVVYRGDNFPESFYGLSLTPAPAGNLISARHIVEGEGHLAGKEVYENAEILASSDERFRPVNLYTAPDGSLYILDMYHGIVQHKVFVTSYLRKQILSRGLDKGNNTMGRIYRLRWADKPARPQTKLNRMPPVKLVKYLAHPNGWYRDMARQLLVQHNDRSVVPHIEELIAQSRDHRAQINALWTLEGMDSVTGRAIQAGLSAVHPKVKVSAVAVAEKVKAQPKKIAFMVMSMANNASYEVALQIALSSGSLSQPEGLTAAKMVLAQHGKKPLMHEALMSGLAGQSEAFLAMLDLKKDEAFLNKWSVTQEKAEAASGYDKLKPKHQKAFDEGSELYTTIGACFACHGQKGEGMPNMGPPLAESEWVTGDPKRLAALMLHGLSGPIMVNGVDYNPLMVMPGLGVNPLFSDAKLASIATFMRNNWGNDASPVSARIFEEVRNKTQSRQAPYTVEQLNLEFSANH